MGMGFILMPVRLKPVYETWHKVSRLIGLTITTVALTLAYYLVITPTAYIKRIVSGRPLQTEPDKRVATYWVEREEHAQPKERFIKRY